jgi:uncharacterized protein (DUF433 family)
VEHFDRITTNVARLNGEPCIRDLRLTVRRVLEALATYPDRSELKREYPELEDEDIRQALAFAAALVDDKVLEIVALKRFKRLMSKCGAAPRVKRAVVAMRITPSHGCHIGC